VALPGSQESRLKRQPPTSGETRLLCRLHKFLNYCLQPAGDVHVHEDAFVRVAWGRLPFADSTVVFECVAGGCVYWGWPRGSVS
jgi:hypothetical protein